LIPEIQVFNNPMLVNHIARYLPLQSSGRLAQCDKQLSEVIKDYLYLYWMRRIQNECLHQGQDLTRMYTWLSKKQSGDVAQVTYFALEVFRSMRITEHFESFPTGLLLAQLSKVTRSDEHFLLILSLLYERLDEEDKTSLYQAYSSDLMECLVEHPAECNERKYKHLFIDFFERGWLDVILDHEKFQDIIDEFQSEISSQKLQELLILKLLNHKKYKISGSEILNLLSGTKEPETLELIIKSPAFRPDLVNRNGCSALELVPEDIRFAKMLLDAGVDPTRKYPVCRFITSCDSAEKIIDVIKLFHSKNPRSLEDTESLIDAVILKLKFDVSPAIEYLQSVGISFNGTNKQGKTWLRCAAKNHKDHPRVIEALLRGGATLWALEGTFPDVKPELALYYVCSLGRMEDLKKWPLNSFPVLKPNRETPFIVALKFGHIDVAKFLLERTNNQCLALDRNSVHQPLGTAFTLEDPQARAEMTFLILEADSKQLTFPENQIALAKLAQVDLALFEKVFESNNGIFEFRLLASNYTYYLEKGDLDSFLAFEKLFDESLYRDQNPLFKCMKAQNGEQMVRQLIEKYPNWVEYEVSDSGGSLLFSYDRESTLDFSINYRGFKYRPIFKLTPELRAFFYDKLLTEANIKKHHLLHQIYEISPFLKKERWLEIKHKIEYYALDFSKTDGNDTKPLQKIFNNIGLYSRYTETDVKFIIDNFSEVLWVVCDMITFAWERRGNVDLYHYNRDYGGGISLPLHAMIESQFASHPILYQLIAQIIEHLVKIGYPIHLQTFADGTPLNLAYKINNGKMIKTLLDAGAKKRPDEKTYQNEIEWAKIRGNVRMLLGRLYNIWDYDP
jgi:ankyrin repeat protein